MSKHRWNGEYSNNQYLVYQTQNRNFYNFKSDISQIVGEKLPKKFNITPHTQKLYNRLFCRQNDLHYIVQFYSANIAENI